MFRPQAAQAIYPVRKDAIFLEPPRVEKRFPVEDFREFEARPRRQAARALGTRSQERCLGLLSLQYSCLEKLPASLELPHAHE